MSESDTPAWSVVLSQTDQSGLAYAHQQPKSVDELSFLLAAAQKNNTAIVIGSPSRIPPKTDVTSLVYADISSLKNVIEYSVPDQVIHVQTGITIGDLRKLLAANNQWWPVYVPDDWTLLDVLNSGEGGAAEHGFQGVRDLVLGCTVATATSSVINCGGKVVKNVTGYDMTKVFVGARGTLGAIVSAQLRLYAMPQFSCSLAWDFADISNCLSLCSKLVKSGLPLAALSIRNTESEAWRVVGQAQGLEDVVNEVAESAGALQPGSVRTDAQSSEESWRSMTQQFVRRDDGSTLKIACPASLTRNIGDQLAKFGQVEIRPYRGKIIVVSPDAKGLTSVVGNAAQASAPIVVAFADEKYNYRIRRFPSSDATLAELQARLKREFDPADVLNPFASL